jgi:hypothetical protein
MLPRSGSFIQCDTGSPAKNAAPLTLFVLFAQIRFTEP